MSRLALTVTTRLDQTRDGPLGDLRRGECDRGSAI